MEVGAAEFRQRFSGRYFGRYRALVVDNDDPKKAGRLKLQVPVVLGEEVIGWALSVQGGGLNSAHYWSPDVDDFVWCEFEEGDPQRPIWSMGPWGRVEGEDMLPKHGRAEFDDEDVLVRDIGVMPPTGFEGTYPNVRGWRTKAGHILEMDDTPNAERTLFAHRSGSRRETFADGSVQEVSVGSYRRRVGGNVVEEITGNFEQVIGGSRSVTVRGTDTTAYSQDLAQTYENLAVTGRSKTEDWGGDLTVDVAGNYALNVASQASLQTGGQFAMMVGQNLQATVLETLELSASNATGIPLTANGVLLHAYNSRARVKSTDVTGLIVGGEIVFEPLPLANLKLGGDLALEPFVLGNQLVALLTTILTDLSTHVHPTGVGPSGAPVTFSVYTSALAQLPTLLSLKILGA